MKTTILGSIVPYTYLLDTAALFAVIVVCILLFIALFLRRNSSQQQKKQQYRAMFNDLIAEVTLCDSEEELNSCLQQFLVQKSDLMQNSFARKTLIKELVKTKDSISGQSANNLCWLYETLGLDKDTLKRFTSEKWYRKASAIQHWAEMQQKQYLVKIYRETNNRNHFIRTEAQIAVVKLTGFEGLRFLNIVNHPVSQWQQLSLISQLQEGEIAEDKIKGWLSSKNETVVEFALRLIEIYKCYDLHDAVAETLQHPSEIVRLQALQALKEISSEHTSRILVDHFQQASKKEQLQVLQMLCDTENSNHEVSFLTSLLQHEDEAIRYAAMQAIQQISPAWSNVVIRQMQHNPSFTYILSTLEKKAV